MKVPSSVIATVVSVLALASASYAVTPPAFLISDSSGDSVVVDSTGTFTCVGTCTNGGVTASGGTVSWSGTIGVINITSLMGQSKPFLTAPQINLRSGAVNTSSNAVTLTIEWSDVGFGGVGPFTLTEGTTLTGNLTTSFASYVDTTDTLFGTPPSGQVLPALSPSSPPGSFQTVTDTAPAGPGPFSMTNLVVVNFGAGAPGSFFSLAGNSFMGKPTPLQLSCVAATTGQVGVPYSSSLVATGGVPPYTFSISSGSLPSGLSLNTSTGAITGTPTTAGPFSFTAKVVDSTGTSAGTTTSNCLIGITLGSPPPSPCTQASFNGTYQFNEAAVLLGGTNVGTLVADGAGHFTTTQYFYATALFPGSLLPLLPQAFLASDINQGTYQVNPDCTMTLVFHPSHDNCFLGNGSCFFPVHFDAVLVKRGTAFYMIATDPGVLGSGAGQKI